ncbi:MAG TPA: GtrA family protein [Steroidobacter sp.]
MNTVSGATDKPDGLRQFIRFAGVGALGFAIDAGIFLLLTAALADWSIQSARATSIVCSITATWALNRRVTFAQRKSRHRAREYLRYLLVQLAGLVVNIGVFASALWIVPALRRIPVLALLAGAAAALGFNFLAARSLAFRKDASS